MNGRSMKLLGVGLVLAVLGGGVGLGIAVDRLWLRPTAKPADGKKQRARRNRDPQVRTDRLMKRFRTQLDLDAQQEQVVRQAVLQMFTEHRALHQKMRPEKKRIRQAARAKIRAALRADQRARYEKMLQAYLKRRAERRRSRR